MSLCGSALTARDGGGVILHLTAAGVDLNNECHWTTDGGCPAQRPPSASGPAVGVFLALLLVFLPSLACAKTQLHYLTHAFPHENRNETKPAGSCWTIKIFWEGSTEPHVRHREGPQRYMEKVTLNKACQDKQHNACRGRSWKIIARIYHSKTLSWSCLDYNKELRER